MRGVVCTEAFIRDRASSRLNSSTCGGVVAPDPVVPQQLWDRQVSTHLRDEMPLHHQGHGALARLLRFQFTYVTRCRCTRKTCTRGRRRCFAFQFTFVTRCRCTRLLHIHPQQGSVSIHLRDEVPLHREVCQVGRQGRAPSQFTYVTRCRCTSSAFRKEHIMRLILRWGRSGVR